MTGFVGIGLVVPNPAGAQGIDPGVNYDPKSPAGKQYAIPLALGRAEGAGTEDQRAAANTPFGVGIRPPTRTDRAASGKGTGSRSGSGSRSGAASRRAPSAAERGRMVRAEEPADTALWSLAIALAVVVPAAALAAGLSTRQPRPAE